MDNRLIPVNAFIALASPHATSWPNTLFSIGYTLEGLEVPATVAGGRVVLDCVAFDASANRFLLGEGKSGNNIEPEQALRYGQVDPRDLVRLIGVTLTMPGEQIIEPLYLCLADAADRIQTGLDEAGCAYPILAIGSDEITLHGSQTPDSVVSTAFASPVPVNGPPPAVIRVDELSEDDEYDSLVAAALVAEVAQGNEVIACTELAARAIPYLHLFGTGHRNTLVRAVTRAAQRFCDAASENFEFRGTTQSRSYAVVRVLDNPERSDPRGRTQRYQAMKARMAGVSPASDVRDRQGSLFDEIDLAAELEKADTEEPHDEGLDEEVE